MNNRLNLAYLCVPAFQHGIEKTFVIAYGKTHRYKVPKKSKDFDP